MLSESEINQKADDLLKRYGIEKRAPIDIMGLINKMNINCEGAIFVDADEDISGYIHKKNSDCTILVNALDGEKRQRFTIAHELGHYSLHMTGVEAEYVDWRTKKYDTKEKEANTFAAALLMPECLVRKIHSELKRPLLNVLAKKFNVSEIAMKIRLIDLGLEYEQ